MKNWANILFIAGVICLVIPVAIYSKNDQLIEKIQTEPAGIVHTEEGLATTTLLVGHVHDKCSEMLEKNGFATGTCASTEWVNGWLYELDEKTGERIPKVLIINGVTYEAK